MAVTMEDTPDTSRDCAGQGWWLVSVLMHAALLLVLFTGKAPMVHGRAGAQIIEVSLVEGPKGGQPGTFLAEHDRRQPVPPRQMERRKEVKAAKPAPSAVSRETMVRRSERAFLRTVETVAVLSSEVPVGESAGALDDSEASGVVAGAESNGSSPSAGEGAAGQAGTTTGGSVYSQNVDTAQILRKIEATKRYPPAARKIGIEGTPVVRFRLEPSGQIESAEIVESSGSEILDRAALKNIRDAAPLPYVEGWQKVEIVFKLF